MVVNTASECGFAPQFEQLEELYREKRSDGFVILGFPADDVAGQEPRSDEEIAEFCEANFGVSFPMFAKTNVIGEEANPLFKALAAEAGEPAWNFNKYLLDRDGERDRALRRLGRSGRPGPRRADRVAAGGEELGLVAAAVAQVGWLVGRIRISLMSTRSGWERAKSTARAMSSS